MLIEELAGSAGWRFREGAEAVAVSAGGVLVEAPPDERAVREGDRVAYWDALLLDAAEWLANEAGVERITTPDGCVYDPTLLALDRRPIPDVPAAGLSDGDGGRLRTAGTRHRPDWGTLAVAHHFPEDYDRCVLVAGRHVCRRCLVLYPLAIITAVVSYAVVGGNGSFDRALLWLVPIPATVDFVGEQLGWWRYSRRRLVVVMVPMALAFGRGVGRYLAQPSDRLFWAVLLVNCAILGAAAMAGHQRRERDELFEPGSV